MKFKYILSILPILLLASIPSRAQSDIDYMQNYDTLRIYNCRGNSGALTVTDQPFFEEFDSWAIIYGTGQPTLLQYSVSESAGNGSQTDIICSDTTIHHDGNVAPTSFTTHSDTIKLHFHRDVGTNGQLALNWSSPQPVSCDYAPYVQIISFSTDSVHFRWSDANLSIDTVLVSCGPIRDMPTADHDIHLGGLAPGTKYQLQVRSLADSLNPCCATRLAFRTDIHILPCEGMPDMQDLESYYCQCYYGSFVNPYQHEQYTPGRHTLLTDTSARDPFTGNQLRTVCPGTSSSVRLGNSRAGAEAEAITYKLRVDTLLYSLLLLRYAAVLQTPNHAAAGQPRFRFEILDANQTVIDPQCGMADFISSASLGWNDAGNEQVVLWKDWTTVGFDLAPYHGQTILLRFTTYDCSAGGHFGYAYFNAECIPKSVASESCGIVDSNSVTAPDGFHYTWYTQSPSAPLSTQQCYTFSTLDAYVYCRLTSVENSQCYVTMSTYTGNRLPRAVADTLSVSLSIPDCQGYNVRFIDRSIIVNSLGHSTGESVEARRWYFDDGDSSTLAAPTHHFADTGQHQVTLVASIAGGLCTDTAVLLVHAPPPPHLVPHDRPVDACDSFLVGDRYYTSDTTVDYLQSRPGSCDSLLRYHLHIHPGSRTALQADTFCYSAPYTWHGLSAGTTGTTDTLHFTLADTLASANGCDSIVSLPLVQLPRLPVAIDRTSDCGNKSYRLAARTALPYLRWSSMPDDSLLDGHRTDSVVYVRPGTVSQYCLSADHRPTPFCPSHDTVTLLPVGFPHARLEVRPEAVDADRPMLIAYDISHEDGPRAWRLLPYPDGTDTLFLTDTAGTLRHPLTAPMPDSLQVILCISNDICYDTARRTVPVLRQLVWAPNVFTPGEDANNRFTISGTGLLEAELSIYNRWGLLLYHTADPAHGWDGTCEGRPCPQAAYVWHLRFRSATHPDNWQTATGTVTLLR